MFVVGDCQIPNGTRYSGKELESMRLTSQFYEVMSLGCKFKHTINTMLSALLTA